MKNEKLGCHFVASISRVSDTIINHFAFFIIN